jgi:hypothetical protein
MSIVLRVEVQTAITGACINSIAAGDRAAGGMIMRVIDFTTAVTARDRAARFASVRLALRKMFKRWANDRRADRQNLDDPRH